MDEPIRLAARRRDVRAFVEAADAVGAGGDTFLDALVGALDEAQAAAGSGGPVVVELTVGVDCVALLVGGARPALDELFAPDRFDFDFDGSGGR